MKLQQSHRAGGPTTPTPADLSVGFLQRGMVRYKPCSGGNRRMCISDKNPHDLLSLVLRLIRDLDDRQSEDPSGILRSCAGWIPLCRSICGPGTTGTIQTAGLCVSSRTLWWRDVGENVHSRCRSLICMRCTLSTTSCAPEVSAQPFILMGWRVGQAVAHAACNQQSIHTLLFLHDVRNLTSAVLPDVVWLELAPSLLPCMAEDSTPPQDHIGFCPWARSHVLSHGRIPSSDPAPVLRNLSLMSPCGHVVQTTPDSEVVHDVNWSSITILG